MFRLSWDGLSRRRDGLGDSLLWRPRYIGISKF